MENNGDGLSAKIKQTKPIECPVISKDVFNKWLSDIFTNNAPLRGRSSVILGVYSLKRIYSELGHNDFVSFINNHTIYTSEEGFVYVESILSK
jgi:hypothetical protein